MWKAASISGVGLCALVAVILHLTPATSEAMRIEQEPTCEVKAQRQGCGSRQDCHDSSPPMGRKCIPARPQTLGRTRAGIGVFTRRRPGRVDSPGGVRETRPSRRRSPVIDRFGPNARGVGR